MQVSNAVEQVVGQVRKAIAGQDRVIEQLLVGVLANGHILLEGVPGVAKTLLVRTFAKTLDLEYGRVQFTPDLMPSDVIGTSVYDLKTNELKLRRGPIFVNVLLADEINRTPPKTQAALLEAMEERQSTIDGVPQPLPNPFFVFATQNPIDFEGTYPLPEAQQDRFLLKVLVDYPGAEAEIEVMRRHHAGFRPQSLEAAGITPVCDQATLLRLQSEVAATTVEDKVFDYIYQIVEATRKATDLKVGASPRAGIALLNAGKALARIRGRDFVIPDDIKELGLPVLRHRVLLRPESEVEGLTTDQVLHGVLDRQVVPR
jgi:MoxR-like ATPase